LTALIISATFVVCGVGEAADTSPMGSNNIIRRNPNTNLRMTIMKKYSTKMMNWQENVIASWG
jgi:hypothetical protein